MKFIDIVKIFVKSGHGGKGGICFRKEKFYPLGGPNGGNGGKGGDVIFEVYPQISTLLNFRFNSKFIAEDGKKGMGGMKTGRGGKDVLIKVPAGTVIKNKETGEVLADLDKDNLKVVLFEGGIGGRGNAQFATSTRQAPRFSQDGREGQELELVLELKLLADVGLVGYPNVGKSTLISVISAAKPKIADYHFTTLIPNLGIVKIGETESYVVADIPGLIEGAAEGKGLGIQFLRHVERTRLLLFMLDSTSANPKKDYKILFNELIKFNPEMKFKTQMICFSKCDLIDKTRMSQLKRLKFDTPIPPFFISAATHLNTENLKFEMWNTIKAMV